MQLEKIITLANTRVELYFHAMERSLRATGCTLPIWVIPYDDHRFDLPPNAQWWEDSKLFEWLALNKTPPYTRKYLCLLTANYQFVDTDVVFLRDPAVTLRPCSGFITSCGHWHNPGDCVTRASEAWLRARTTRWPAFVFNTGQFACDRALYNSCDNLRRQAEAPDFRATCLDFPYHEQPGINLLVAATGVPVTNLTLPLSPMESTWAGDYPGEFASYWQPPERQPYLIHWAGLKADGSRPIDKLFTQQLTEPEQAAWQAQIQGRRPPGITVRWRTRLRAVRKAWREN